MTIETSRSVLRRTTSFVDTSSFISRAACVTIKHWQLRDLVCKTSNPREVLYACNDFAVALDMATGKSTVCAKFTFEPRCIATAFDFVAAGGVVQRGQLGVTYRPSDPESTSPVTTIELGGYINNSISLFKARSSSVSALVCNNDHTLRIVDISPSGYSVLSTMQVPVPLNHASISADQKVMIACGDSAHLFMFHPEERLPSETALMDEFVSTHVDSTNWKQTLTLPTSMDAGFSTAFSPSGVLFAVAAQDGVASIFDSRMLPSKPCINTHDTVRPLKYLESTRPREGLGAFRCLKFSSGAEDLLLIAEQAGRVHVVDTRRLEDRQILEIPPVLPRSRARREDYGAGNGSSSWRGRRYLYSLQRPPPPPASSSDRRPVGERRISASGISVPVYSLATDDSGPSSRPCPQVASCEEPSQERYDGDVDERESSEGQDDDEVRCCDVETESTRQESTAETLRVRRSFRPAPDFLSSLADMPIRARSYAFCSAETDISGLAWSDEDGGSIIVGWDTGIGQWSVDRWGRRVFPSYNMR
ncbi:uncharacterized protein V1518DRAFT_408612 [Limtongia smithiae]|uniref:uncharacterized protein n=1 Tax=Limtongia smithiae TaxID=1125753 RepID=UPI0034CD4FE1